MNRTPVTSQVAKSIGWQDGLLEVEFHNGRVFTYPVSAEQYAELQAAPSVGGYFSKHIRPLGGTLVEAQEER